MQQRNVFFDIAKGIGIFLVVIGHSIQYFSDDWQSNHIFLCIIMFHMPLFMAISGYFLYPSVARKNIRIYTKNKTHQLLLPSGVYGATTVGLLATNDILDGSQIAFYDYTLSFFHGLWYLVVLYVICVLASIIQHLCKSKRLRYVTWAILCIAIQFSPSDLVFNGLKTLLPFAAIAVAFRYYNWERIPMYIACISLFVFLWSFKNYSFNDSMYTISTTALGTEFWYAFFIRITAGISGTIITLYTTKYLSKIPIINETLANLGRTTLPIYVIQAYIFFAIMFSHIIIHSLFLKIIIGVLIIALCFGCYKIFKRYKYIRFLFFGQKL